MRREECLDMSRQTTQPERLQDVLWKLRSGKAAKMSEKLRRLAVSERLVL